jgi:hypothetical protein
MPWAFTYLVFVKRISVETIVNFRLCEVKHVNNLRVAIK